MNSPADGACEFPAPVSAIIPCFRCSGTIARAVESVANQTRLPAELILVDDFSQDGTLRVLEQLAERYGKGWVRIVPLTANEGAGTARNRGWEVATQSFVAFLDADDAWDHRKIEVQCAYMLRHPGIVMTGHDHQQLKPASPIPRSIQAPISSTRITPRALLLSNRFITPSIMLRRDLPFRFMEGRRHMEDYLLWLRIVCSGYRIEKLVIPLAYVYKAPVGEEGLSSQLFKMAKSDLSNYCELRRDGLINRLTAWVLYAYSTAKSIRRIGLVACRRRFLISRRP